MSIEIVTGVPGSGKSYYSVHRIKKLLDTSSRFLVLHNIEGLAPLDNRCLPVNWVSIDFNAQAMQERLKSLRSEYQLQDSDLIHIYVDEAQRFFPPDLKDADILYFFDYHRHYGVNITLITQHEKKLTFKITSLAEVEIRAVSSRINPFGSFVYKLSSGGEQYATERLSKDKAVFALYKSFQAGSGTVKKSRFRYIVLAIVVLAVVAWFIFFRFFAESFGIGGEQPLRELPKAPTADKPLLPSIPGITRERPRDIPVPAKDVELSIPKTEYLGPEIFEYNPIQDMVFISDKETDFKGYISVASFVEKYPPQVYGYGYFHSARKRFVLMSASNQELIFPVKNPVYVRSYIRSEPQKPATQAAAAARPEPPDYPLEYADKTMMPDSRGYTRADYERLFMYRHGFKYSQPEPAAIPPAAGGTNASL